MNEQRKHMKFSVFLRKNGRIIIGGTILAFIAFCSIFAPLLTSWDPEELNITAQKALPSAEHLMGTDYLGRDIWSRILYGSRTTLLVSIGSQLFLIVTGTILGLACGYYKKLEKVLMRVLDAFATVPNLLLCLLIISVFGAGVPQMIIALAIHGIPGHARMVRNQVLSLREKEYIESEYAMGAGDLRTLFKHILPACSSYIFVRFSNGLAGMVLSMTSLSFLGIGLDPTIASWGGMVQDGQKLMFAMPHLVFYPALAICITVFGFAMLGDGLRDKFDPRLK